MVELYASLSFLCALLTNVSIDISMLSAEILPRSVQGVYNSSMPVSPSSLVSCHVFLCPIHADLVLQSHHRMLSNDLEWRGMIEMIEIEMIGPFCIVALPSF